MSNVISTLIERANDQLFIQIYWDNLEKRKKIAAWVSSDFEFIINNTSNDKVKREMIDLNNELNKDLERAREIVSEFYHRDSVQIEMKKNDKEFAEFLFRVSNERNFNNMMFRIRKAGGINKVEEKHWKNLTYRLKYNKKR